MTKSDKQPATTESKSMVSNAVVKTDSHPDAALPEGASKSNKNPARQKKPKHDSDITTLFLVDLLNTSQSANKNCLKLVQLTLSPTQVCSTEDDHDVLTDTLYRMRLCKVQCSVTTKS